MARVLAEDFFEDLLGLAEFALLQIVVARVQSPGDPGLALGPNQARSNEAQRYQEDSKSVRLPVHMRPLWKGKISGKKPRIGEGRGARASHHQTLAEILHCRFRLL